MCLSSLNSTKFYKNRTLQVHLGESLAECVFHLYKNPGQHMPVGNKLFREHYPVFQQFKNIRCP